METEHGRDRWLRALQATSDRLNDLVHDLSEEELTLSSFADDWSIAQVLSHLGSATEISMMLIERGIAGNTEGPVREDVLPVWERWDAMSPREQRSAWRKADARHLDLVGSLTGPQRDSVGVPYFAGLLSIPVYEGYRLSEQSVHAWDIAVALDPGATIPPDEVSLLWERIDLVATRFRDGATLDRLAPAQLAIELTDRGRRAFLDLGAELHIHPAEAAEPVGTLTGTTEAVVRLVYGRYRPETDELKTTGPVLTEDLRALFPGF